MSAPTSLIATMQQQASCKTSNGELSSIAEDETSKRTRLTPIKSKEFELIENKFDELSKKILDELKQAQYSKDFFQAVDDILKEPTRKSFNLLSRRAKIANQSKYYSSRLQQANQQPQARSCDQPRSLPADVAHLILHQQQKQRLIQQQQQQQQQLSYKTQQPLLQQPSQPQPQQQSVHKSPQKSAIPTISNGLLSKSPLRSAGDDRSGHQISRSATVGAADATTNLRRQQQLRRLSTQATKSNQQQQQFDADRQVASAVHATTLSAAQRRPKQAHSADSSSLAQSNGSSGIRRLVPHRDYCDGDDDDDEDDDDDDENDDDEDDENDGYDERDRDTPNDRPMSLVGNHGVKHYKQQSAGIVASIKPNPIIKSKTLSDATNISEMNMLTKRNDNTNNAKLQQNSLLQTHNQRPRFNPIVRSNTISSAGQRANQEREMYLQAQQDSEPKSIVLNGKDFGSLWKPHMNYSTSVLGNHRLSDDDEIIIIPTQSPSFVSPSPDGGDPNADELTERFSISRTKSFWEKLSKGGHGRRSANNNDSSDNGQARGGNQTQSHHHHHHHRHGENKVMDAKMNGLSRTLDRMDSTGGSNSNYSCSSSGDENSGCHSQQNPIVSQLQEMSRQNRLRQTR